jgi:hypothetical protein
MSQIESSAAQQEGTPVDRKRRKFIIATRWVSAPVFVSLNILCTFM